MYINWLEFNTVLIVILHKINDSFIHSFYVLYFSHHFSGGRCKSSLLTAGCYGTLLMTTLYDRMMTNAVIRSSLLSKSLVMPPLAQKTQTERTPKSVASSDKPLAKKLKLLCQHQWSKLTTLWHSSWNSAGLRASSRSLDFFIPTFQLRCWAVTSFYVQFENWQESTEQ